MNSILVFCLKEIGFLTLLLKTSLRAIFFPCFTFIIRKKVRRSKFYFGNDQKFNQALIKVMTFHELLLASFMLLLSSYIIQ